MANAGSNPPPKQQDGAQPTQHDDATAARDEAASSGRPRRKLSPTAIAGKAPTGLPPIDLDTYEADSGDPVKRAASRIVSIDNANMAATDDAVDVDGKGMEARADRRERHDNVVYSNASPDENVDTPDEGLGGFDSRPGGLVPRVVARPGWTVRYGGTVTVAHGEGTREEHVIRLEPPAT